MSSLVPDREMLAQFAGLMFKHARPDAFVSLRLFPDQGSKDDKPIDIEAIRINDKDFLDTTVIRATQAATWHEPAVFCPPVATFLTSKNAKTENLCEGPCLSVECDQSPREARLKLEALLGPATAVVESGGEWINPATGEVEPKVHLHWRLKKPTATKEEHKLLREARDLATELAGGDDTNKSIVHPIRWPGSVHRKNTPRLAKTVAFSDDNEIDLTEAIERLRESGAATFAGFGLDLNKTGGTLEACNHAAAVSAFSVIPNNDLNWHDWNRIGMAMWAATNGSEIGRKAFAEWSAKSAKNDPAATEARWQHHRTSPPTKLGFGTLVWLARQHSPGWTYDSPKGAPTATPEPEAESPDTVEITRLARLKPLDYERERKAAAEKLGIKRLRTLDDLVQARRDQDAAERDAAERAKKIKPAPSDVIERLNKVHAVLPIGGKTRVVKFGEMEEFPGRETIVMTQTVDDFKALQNKYRHSYQDEEGETRTIPLGSYWIRSQERRQYDGGMAFMPQYDGDVGKRLNLWRGFGVKAIKPDGKSGAAGCQKFLEFMRVIICNGNDAHFEYLLKREATIVQKRTRSEIALGLRTKEEGCGKGFYEATMGRLLGTHAMQVSNPKHIVGAFNPHLETLLRLTADEALFVGNHEHRNALFGLITEPTLTIEPKGCGLYKASSFLNLSVTSNADHFLPVSGTARRFLIPTVSVARMQDHKYFNGLKAELEDGGYEALLYHLLHEVNLAGFNVRAVPQTEELRQQRDLSLPPLEAWWCELLETGTLWGADPLEPCWAVSNSYQREIEVETKSRYGDTSTQTRYVTQLGIYDQARRFEPRLRTASDHCLGRHLSKMGCTSGWVLRRRGWMFPPLSDCRDEWVKRYTDWTWRSPGSAAWTPEESDDVTEMEADDPPF